MKANTISCPAVELNRPASGRRGQLLLLIVVLGLGAPGIVQAQFEYTSDGESITITGYTGPGGEVLIPETIDGLPVSEIGSKVFAGCDSVISVTIPSSVTTIDLGSFATSALECRSLNRIEVAPSNAVFSSFDGILYDKNGHLLIRCPGARVGSLTLPTGLTTNGGHAFAHCVGLTTITIPDSVVSIGQSAFAGCSRLIGITIPDGVTGIGKWTFSDCTSLSSVVIGNGVTAVSLYAFEDCASLARVTIGEGLTNIHPWTFLHQSLTGFEVVSTNPAYTAVDGILYDKDGRTLILCPRGATGHVTIPDGVVSIEDNAFAYCSNLTGITIPDSVTTIEDGAFAYCEKLASVVLPDGLTRLEREVFYGCTSLKTLTIPPNATSIGGEVFSECPNLTSLYFEGNAPVEDDHPGTSFANTTGYRLPGSEGWEVVWWVPVEVWRPRIVTEDGSFGASPEGFGFDIEWAGERGVEVEAATDPTSAEWALVKTLTLDDGKARFADPDATATSRRFYRLRGQ